STGGSTALTNFYTDNPFVGGDEDPIEAILKERMREFMFEGKRWHDIRLVDKATKYSTASADRLLWPIDETTKSTNAELKQTPGYGD
ncbi:MAG: RagB/SusD family nutrient uptake outer membrane protein, partial [Prevotella sp.]|nr:RagB/SusD family nutrient uptake outer membrane protein [Prevotella sp.]